MHGQGLPGQKHIYKYRYMIISFIFIYVLCNRGIIMNEREKIRQLEKRIKYLEAKEAILNEMMTYFMQLMEQLDILIRSEGKKNEKND